jgi:hypothetical protein
MAPVRSRRRLMGGAAALIALAAAVTTGLVIAGHSPSSGSVPGRVTGVSVAAGTYPAGVSWNAARSRGAPVLDYVVFDGSNAACRATPSHTDTNWCALYHVPLGRRFHVTVVAENRFGASMPSRTVAGFVGDAEVGPPVSGPLATYAQTTAEGYGGVVGVGTAVDTSSVEWTLQSSYSYHGPLAGRRCIARRCVALGGGGFQYPFVSDDGGRTWRVAAHWFAGDWADGAAFATSISMLTPTVWLAPNGISADGFYLTMDAGRRWYQVGVGTWVAHAEVRNGRLELTEFGADHGHPAHVTYATSSGGTWQLV